MLFLLKKSCNCGCTLFYVNQKDMMVYCPLCKQRYLRTEQGWIEFKVDKKNPVNYVIDRIETGFQNIEESISEFKKRLGIEKIKKKKEQLTEQEVKILDDYKASEEIKKKQLAEMWKKEIELLLRDKTISFNKNEHKGKLRGKHIAVIFNKDLKHLGYKTKLYFRADKANIDLVVENGE